MFRPEPLLVSDELAPLHPGLPPPGRAGTTTEEEERARLSQQESARGEAVQVSCSWILKLPSRFIKVLIGRRHGRRMNREG